MGYYIDIPFLANMCAWAYEYDIWDSVLILNSKIVLPDLKENISKDSLSKWLNSNILKIDFLLCPKTIIQKKNRLTGPNSVSASAPVNNVFNKVTLRQQIVPENTWLRTLLVYSGFQIHYRIQTCFNLILN